MSVMCQAWNDPPSDRSHKIGLVLENDVLSYVVNKVVKREYLCDRPSDVIKLRSCNLQFQPIVTTDATQPVWN